MAEIKHFCISPASSFCSTLNHIELLSVLQAHRDWSIHIHTFVHNLLLPRTLLGLLPGQHIAVLQVSADFSLLPWSPLWLPKLFCPAHVYCSLHSAGFQLHSICYFSVWILVLLASVLFLEDRESFCPPVVLRTLLHHLPSPGAWHIVDALLVCTEWMTFSK